PYRHAARLSPTEAGLPPPPGTDESQHQRRTLHVDPHGRPQLPNRTPLVPLDGPSLPPQGTTPGPPLPRARRRAIYPDDVVAVLRGRHPLPQQRRTSGKRPLPLPARCTAPRVV